jgi:erythronate-4-phosphate dehydrogenase
MHILIDRNIPFGESVFGTLGDVTALETGDIRAAAVRKADILIIRSETKVNAALLEGSPVRFVGTATIGTDHIDLEYLAAHGIGFSSAPGCNANSVAEYIASALLTVSHRLNFELAGKTLGVVGVGNIGSKVVRVGQALGMKALQNDPPLARLTGDSKFVPLDALMDADIITLHVPLSKTGSDATFHLFDSGRIGKMKPGSILMNASRGAVVETSAMRDALTRKHLAAALLDVWEKEPAINAELLCLVDIGTAHVAGYSLDGKVNAVRIVYHALCKHLGVQPTWAGWDSLPAPATQHIAIPAQAGRTEDTLRETISQCYNIELDDQLLRGMLEQPEEHRTHYFMKLRTGYRMRREFYATTVEVPSSQIEAGRTLQALGFKIEPFTA